ncbi:aryl hydrocarbon receptor nuclear translocator-like protein 2 isoform X2 [Sceloporus undulatus]|uniref:aryl hydrocarbon receptor nuclear translocator-like protein 2 isoform X2 n=1 Tax=Sceloporus undulatus TaxID=8520 RepID=UPI001C4DC87F|nr:aryl hydrocarbon receptor nuclear translocator-like protein 2 isoform X2 [Sceloporus undulatus]
MAAAEEEEAAPPAPGGEEEEDEGEEEEEEEEEEAGQGPSDPSAATAIALAAIKTDNRQMEEAQCVASAVSSLMSPTAQPATASSINTFAVEFPRKRKGSDSDNQYACDIDVDDLQSRSEDEEHVKIKYFREAHSQTEKRRRDKMNNLIEELSAMIPQCNPVARKLDKLTVLRMTVQHLKSLKSSSSSYSEIRYKPSFLQDSELQHLILKAADGFLFVVGCDRGKILFVSESVSTILNYDPASLIGQSLFDYLHPKDVAKVKEQLSSSDASPREKLIDTKTGLQVHTDFQAGSSRLHSGARRSFFCRIKCTRNTVKEEKESLPNSKKKDHKKYCTVHCTGYLKNWPPNEVGVEEESDAEKGSSNFNCLVAIGRLHPYTVPQKSNEIKVKPTEFVTRFAMDGKFVFVDQRATAILGYLPQELLGTSCYEYFHQDDHSHLTEKHKAVLQSKEKIFTNSYKFKAKDGSFVTLKSQWFSFINPWTKELEYIVSINTVVLGHNESGEEALLPCSSLSSEDTPKPPFLSVPGMSTGTVLGAGSIGTEIANEVLDLQRSHTSPSASDLSPSDLMRTSSSPVLTVNCSNVPNKELTQLCPSVIEDLETSGQNQGTVSFPTNEPLLSDASQLDFDAVCENDTAMAALMNYLEAEGGLGDPAELNDMQWTL